MTSSDVSASIYGAVMRRSIVSITSALAMFVGLIGVASVAASSAGAATGHDPLGHLDTIDEASPPSDFDGRTYISGWAAEPDLGTTSGRVIPGSTSVSRP